MLSHHKKAKADAAESAWQKACKNLDAYLPDMITVNNGVPFDNDCSVMTSVEFCFYTEGDAMELAIDVALLLGNIPVPEIQQKALLNGGCEYFQLSLEHAIRYLGSSFCSILLRVTIATNNNSSIKLTNDMATRLIEDITALDEIGCNLLARMHHTADGSHPLTFLAKQNNDAAFYFIDKLEADTCQLIAMQENERGLFFHELHMQIINEETRLAFINKISSDHLEFIACDSNTIKMFTSVRTSQLKAILKSMGDEAANIMMLSQHRAGLYFSYDDRNGFAENTCLAEALFFSSDCRSMTEHNLRYLNDCLRGRLPQKYLTTLGLKEIEFARMGNAIDNWWRVTANVLALAPAPKTRVSVVDELTAPLSKRMMINACAITAITFDTRMERVLGRTLLFRQRSGGIRAVKVKKQTELVSSLAREACVTEGMLELKNKHRLLSRFPTPHRDLVVLQNLIAWAEQSPVVAESQFLSRIDAATEHPAYIYDVKPADEGYLTYLHDPKLTDEEFKQSNRVIVHDLFKLLQLGQVFNQLADLFHDSEKQERRADGGRYIVLAQMLKHTRSCFGTGMLESWLLAIAFPNLRATGIADLGDCISINDYIAMLPHIEQNYTKACEAFGQKAGNYLIANIMAEYQYVLFLIAGRRALELEKAAELRGATEQEKFRIWYNVAKQVILNCVQAISMNTFMSEREALQRINKLVDINRLALQMQFWMTTRYISYLNAGYIPDEIYGDDVKVTVDTEKFKKGNLNKVLGFTSNGMTSDLGDYNGQEPIKEANKLFYWMVNIIFVEFVNVNNMLKDVSTITKSLRQQNAADTKVTISQSQDASDKHVLLFSMWHLHQNVKRKTLKEKLENEHPDVKQKNAAITLQRIWRSRNKRTKVNLFDTRTTLTHKK